MQLAQFTVCVVLARILCGVVVIAASAHLAALAAALDGFFPGRPVALLLFVMVVCPMGMNTGQACVQDQFLKWRDRRGGRTVSSEPHHTLLAIDLEERHGYS
jgi:STIMATE family